MTSNDKSTPKPWLLKDAAGLLWGTWTPRHSVVGPDGQVVANTWTEAGREKEADSNAALIVDAVNIHGAMRELIEAAKRLADHLDARIDSASGDAVPVFTGLADLRSALAKLEEVEALR